MSQGGSHGNRKTAKALSSRAIGAAKASAGKTASRKTKTDSIEASRESSSLAPDYIDLRKGYRAWHGYLSIRGADYAKSWTKKTPLPRALSSIRPGLRSLNMISHWRPKETKEAHCPCHTVQMVGNKVDVREHTCGIYAYKRSFSPYGYSDVISTVLRQPGIVKLEFRVSGSVWMWGDIIEHVNGYRAEYAYPCAFVLPKNASLLYKRALRLLARRYGVDVVSTTAEL